MAPEAAAKGAFLAAGKVLACLCAAYPVATDPRPLFVDWRRSDDLPFAVRVQVELAAKWDPIKRASLSLVCGGGGGLHLVLRARLPVRSVLRLHEKDRAHLTIDYEPSGPKADWKARTLEIERAELVAFGVVDALLTTPLSAAQVEHLAAAFGPTPPRRVSFGTMERAVYLAGSTGAEPVRALATACPRA